MNLETLFATLDNLSPEDQLRVKAYLEQHEQTRRKSVQQTLADLDKAIDDFGGDSSAEEMQAIFDAMRTKSMSAA